MEPIPVQENNSLDFYFVDEPAQEIEASESQRSHPCPPHPEAGEAVQKNSSSNFINHLENTLSEIKRGFCSFFMSSKSSSTCTEDKADMTNPSSLDFIKKVPCQTPFTRLVIFEIFDHDKEGETSPHSPQLSHEKKVKLLKEAGHFCGDFYYFRGRAICRGDDDCNVFTDKIMVYKVYLPPNINDYLVIATGKEWRIYSPRYEDKRNMPKALYFHPENKGDQLHGKVASFIGVNGNIMAFYQDHTIRMPISENIDEDRRILDLKTEIKIFSNLNKDSKEKEYIIHQSKYTLMGNKFIIGILETKLKNQSPESKSNGLFCSLKAASAGTGLNTNTNPLQVNSIIASYSNRLTNTEYQSSRSPYGESVHLLVLLRHPSDKWTSDTAIIDIEIGRASCRERVSSPV